MVFWLRKECCECIRRKGKRDKKGKIIKLDLREVVNSEGVIGIVTEKDIPGINDGSITVIDLNNLEVTDVINTFKNNGKVPNSITLLPEWYNPAGHINNGL